MDPLAPRLGAQGRRACRAPIPAAGHRFDLQRHAAGRARAAPGGGLGGAGGVPDRRRRDPVSRAGSATDSSPGAPLKLYRSTRFDSAATTLVLEGGVLDSAVGKSYHQIAMAGRSLHRSQDMGQLQRIGPSVVRLRLIEDRTGRGGDGLWAGIDTTLAGMAAAGGPGSGSARAVGFARCGDRGLPAVAHAAADRDARPVRVGVAADGRAWARSGSESRPRSSGISSPGCSTRSSSRRASYATRWRTTSGSCRGRCCTWPPRAGTRDRASSRSRSSCFGGMRRWPWLHVSQDGGPIAPDGIVSWTFDVTIPDTAGPDAALLSRSSPRRRSLHLAGRASRAVRCCRSTIP